MKSSPVILLTCFVVLVLSAIVPVDQASAIGYYAAPVKELQLQQGSTSWDTTSAGFLACLEEGVCPEAMPVINVSGRVKTECTSCRRRIEITDASNPEIVVSRLYRAEDGWIQFDLPVLWRQIGTGQQKWMRAHLVVAAPNDFDPVVSVDERIADANLRFARLAKTFITPTGAKVHPVRAWETPETDASTSIITIPTWQQARFEPSPNMNLVVRLSRSTFVDGSMVSASLDVVPQVMDVTNGKYLTWQISWLRDLMPGETVSETITFRLWYRGVGFMEPTTVYCQASRPPGYWQPLQASCHDDTRTVDLPVPVSR